MKTLAERVEIEQFVYREAQLLDDGELRTWLALFADDGLYWVPIDASRGPAESVSIMRDGKLEREERVFHMLETASVAQNPRSTTIHAVSAVTIETLVPGARWQARSTQVIYETRGGDYRQTGLGNLGVHPATVTHELMRDGERLKIVLKKVLLLNRRAALGNLTFFL